jgi:L-arabinose isomerase
MITSETKLRAGIVPLMADLYRRLIPDLSGRIDEFMGSVVSDLSDDSLEVVAGPVSCTEAEIRQTCRELSEQGVDLLVIAHTSYCASGQIAPAILETDLPILLWPAQPMMKLVGAEYDHPTVAINHGVHGTQDLANVLRRRKRPFGLLHGYHQQPGFKDAFVDWTRAGRAVRAMKTSNPVMLGGHFDSMLDLQIDDEPFLKRLGVCGRDAGLEEFIEGANGVSDSDIQIKIDEYRGLFVIGDNVNDALLQKTARHELALRKLLSKYQSRAVGINFQSLCNDTRIGDGLHVAAGMLMADGFGYGGEGDWVTAMMNHGLESATGRTSFSEIFSVGYEDNRLVLRHWGEGNFNLARSRPAIKYSKFADVNTAEFAVVDFEFQPGQATLVNINVTPDGNGQLLTMTGEIAAESLSAVSGPRAIFKPDVADVRELLTTYDYHGGSHHSTLVMGDVRNVVDNIARLTGWSHVRI